MGYALKLDTNGTVPSALRGLLADKDCRPDYIAVDLKLPPRLYYRLAASPISNSEHPTGVDLAKGLEESCRLVASSGIPHEYRTLILPAEVPLEEELQEMAQLTDGAPWYFSPFRGGNCLDPRWNDYSPPADALVLRAVELVRRLGKAGAIRSAHPS